MYEVFEVEKRTEDEGRIYVDFYPNQFLRERNRKEMFVITNLFNIRILNKFVITKIKLLISSLNTE